MKKKIGIKLGSVALVDADGEVNEKLIESVARQVAEIMKNRDAVFIVTSGAVASGSKEGRSRNLKSAVGQSKLMQLYWNALCEIELS